MPLQWGEVAEPTVTRQSNLALLGTVQPKCALCYDAMAVHIPTSYSCKKMFHWI